MMMTKMTMMMVVVMMMPLMIARACRTSAPFLKYLNVGIAVISSSPAVSCEEKDEDDEHECVFTVTAANSIDVDVDGVELDIGICLGVFLRARVI